MSKLHAEDWIEVRSKEEILRSLDERGCLDGMPFMPEMFQYCGKRFRVYKRAHKTCDTIALNWDSPGRSVSNGIHLDLRCDGKAYGGCQAACLIFWKEQWLKPVDGGGSHIGGKTSIGEARAYAPADSDGRCTEADVLNATCAPRENPKDETIYNCQATRLFDYTKPLPWWNAGQYVEDFASGNASLWQILRGAIYVCYYYGTLSNKRNFGAPGRWVYDSFQSLWGGLPFPRHRGRLRPGQITPIATLNLQPGELVRVKSYEDILRTIHEDNKNRGMVFDGEMMPFCGHTYRVRSRVERFVDEKTGKMKTLKTPAVMLDNVYCRARYSNHRMFCPRSIFSWWREVWLERVSENPRQTVPAEAVSGDAITAKSTASASN
jgi:hypothetical protein